MEDAPEESEELVKRLVIDDLMRTFVDVVALVDLVGEHERVVVRALGIVRIDRR